MQDDFDGFSVNLFQDEGKPATSYAPPEPLVPLPRVAQKIRSGFMGNSYSRVPVARPTDRFSVVLLLHVVPEKGALQPPKENLDFPTQVRER